MRRKGDELFRGILKRIRFGVITNDDIKLLAEPKIQLSSDSIDGRLVELCDFLSTLPAETVWLLPTRNMCATPNEQMLNRLSAGKIILGASDSFYNG